MPDRPFAERGVDDLPVRPVDLPKLRQLSATTRDLLASIEPHLPDVHSLAFDRRVVGRAEGSSKPEGFALTDIGERQAKKALAELDHALTLTARAVIGVRNCFASGPSADASLRGTLLGGNGDGAASELGQALQAQGRRRARGEFTSVAVEPQPSVPGFKRPRGSR